MSNHVLNLFFSLSLFSFFAPCLKNVRVVFVSPSVSRLTLLQFDYIVCPFCRWKLTQKKTKYIHGSSGMVRRVSLKESFGRRQLAEREELVLSCRTISTEAIIKEVEKVIEDKRFSHWICQIDMRRRWEYPCRIRPRHRVISMNHRRDAFRVITNACVILFSVFISRTSHGFLPSKVIPIRWFDVNAKFDQLITEWDHRQEKTDETV